LSQGPGRRERESRCNLRNISIGEDWDKYNTSRTLDDRGPKGGGSGGSHPKEVFVPQGRRGKGSPVAPNTGGKVAVQGEWIEP